MGQDATPDALGRVAYKTYCVEVGGKSVRGETLPTWDDQADAIKAAWVAAATAVIGLHARMAG